MGQAISLENIAATALNVLKTPELLYLPETMKESCTREAGDSHKVDLPACLMLVCVVSSPTITLNYYHLWDVDRQHPQQVGTNQCDPIQVSGVMTWRDTQFKSS